MKPVRLNLVSNTARAFIEYNVVRNADDGLATHVLLPIEGDSVGGLEPWMVDWIRWRVWPTPLAEHNEMELDNLVAAAIEAILKEAKE